MPFLNPTSIISILIAVSIHEWAHGMMARRLGDPTAEYAGRLTINPLAHLDFFGTLMFVVAGFGWAKPVPVNPAYFKNPRKGVMLTAAAGPAVNLALALMAYVLLSVLFRGTFDASFSIGGGALEGGVFGTFLFDLLQSSLFINIALMAFNLLPVAPLDGSKVVEAFVPLRYQEDYERAMAYGPYILLFLLLAESFLPFPVLSLWVGTIGEAVLRAFTLLPF